MGEYEKKRIIGTSFLIIAFVLIAIAVIFNLTNGNTTGDITVSGSDKVTGIKCIDTKLAHPVFADVQPVSRTNTITANFTNNRLSSITYKYDGIYHSGDEASNARVLAEADYNLILANEYGVKIDIFSHLFMTDGEKMTLTITDDANKVTSKTAPYFLLDTRAGFPNTLKELQTAYEVKGFSCVVENNDK